MPGILLHLKSREKEIQLFYFDKKPDSKYLRVHFKIATILVATALFFLTLGNSGDLFSILDHIALYIAIPQQLNHIFLTVFDVYFDFICNLSLFISQFLFLLNYSYILIVVVCKVLERPTKIEKHKYYIRPILN